MRARITLTVEVESDLPDAAAWNSLQYFGAVMRDHVQRKMEGRGTVGMSFVELSENVRADWSDGMR